MNTDQSTIPLSVPLFPARPVNGGPFVESSARDGWSYEPKYNGWRALVHTPTGAMFNRQGERLSIESEFKEALPKLGGVSEWLDVEALDRRHGIGRGALIVLDLLDFHCVKPYTERRRILMYAFEDLDITEKPAAGSVWLPPRYSPEAVPFIWTHLQEFNAAWGCPFYEGLVGKKDSSDYPVQLRHPDQEFPFWQKHRWAF